MKTEHVIESVELAIDANLEVLHLPGSAERSVAERRQGLIEREQTSNNPDFIEKALRRGGQFFMSWIARKIDRIFVSRLSC